MWKESPASKEKWYAKAAEAKIEHQNVRRRDEAPVHEGCEAPNDCHPANAHQGHDIDGRRFLTVLLH
jgi:hypothetical protein